MTDVPAIRSLVPARMDRLPWSGFHWRVVIALGITWVLDGIEIGLASAMGDTLRHEQTLSLTAETIGLSAAVFCRTSLRRTRVAAAARVIAAMGTHCC